MTLSQLYEQIAVSLWLKPATLADLAGRDFLTNRSRESVDRVLQALEKEGWVYLKGQKFHTYKAVAARLSERYEL